MTSTAASESPLDGVRGLVFFSFPLHQPGKPETKRADHLAAVTVPMLFLSGTRDELAEMDLLRPVCKKLGGRATLHALDTADHGYKILKRSRTSEEDVFVEMAASCALGGGAGVITVRGQVDRGSKGRFELNGFRVSFAARAAGWRNVRSFLSFGSVETGPSRHSQRIISGRIAPPNFWPCLFMPQE